MKLYLYYCEGETCEECGSDDVITLHDDNGSYDHCNDCGHDMRN